jgi:glycosyltransferase involved in cell wall biosynthesis
MSKPKVSVILPCYNHARFLSERIASIIEQTLQPSQIIFLDDASTDNSVEVAKNKLHNCPIETTIRINRVNSCSPFAQWNLGVALAKHELIWIAESDDSCDPIFLESLYRAITESGSVLCFAQSRQISHSGDNLGSVLDYANLHWPGNFDCSFTCSGDFFNSKFMARYNAIPNASGVLFSRHAYILAGQADPSMRFCGDWEAWLKIVAEGSISFVAEELNMFRCHQQTTRAEITSPRLVAEQFACRLKGLLLKHRGSNQTSGRLNLTQLIKIIKSEDRGDLFFALSLLSAINLPPIITAYSRIRNAPQIGPITWLIIFAGSLGINVKRYLAFLLHAAPS